MDRPVGWKSEPKKHNHDLTRFRPSRPGGRFDAHLPTFPSSNGKQNAVRLYKKQRSEFEVALHDKMRERSTRYVAYPDGVSSTGGIPPVACHHECA